MWIIYSIVKIKPSWKKTFLHIFAIPLSNRRCRMLVRLFCLFHCSRNPQWLDLSFVKTENFSTDITLFTTALAHSKNASIVWGWWGALINLKWTKTKVKTEVNFQLASLTSGVKVLSSQNYIPRKFIFKEHKTSPKRDHFVIW